MATLRVGGERAKERDAVIGQGCGWGPGVFGYSLHLRCDEDKRSAHVRLNPEDALAVLRFLEQHREKIESAVDWQREHARKREVA